MDSQPPRQAEPRILRIFISYASEDLSIAHAVANGLSDALPEGFADVCFDKWFLQAGQEFKKQIESKLEKTDILIIIYTGVDKPSHSFTGWEVGYFERVRKNDPERRIIPMCLDELPAAAAEFEGCSLKMSRELLQLSVGEFSSRNVIAEDDPMCVLIGELQDQVKKIREEAGYPATSPHDKRDPVSCVKNMRTAIFSYLRTTVEAVIKPQKQITFKSTGAALQNSETDLPRDARLIPVGGSPMGIFGLGDEEMTWEKFLQLTAGPHQDSWREAITSVISSSQADRINVDNSQIVLSADESKTYRIILTAATKYWDDTREFNLYFVETLRAGEYGDRDTTLMLKGLEVVCRYRFMFLEPTSQFSCYNLLATREDRFPEMAARLLRELNLIRKEASSAGLDQPVFWARWVGWPLILKMGEVFRPREQVIRELIGRVLNAKDRKEKLTGLREQLATALGELEDATRAPNTSLVEAMARRLLALVAPETQSAGTSA
jgi:nucleoside 2-deoxyribosyltransferase